MQAAARQPLHDLRQQSGAKRLDTGDVPQPAQRFAAAVESLGGAAKISGAGAVRGEAAGVTLVYLPEADAMARLMEDYPDRRWEGLRVSRRGAHLCDDPAAALPAQAGRGAADAP